MIITATMTTNHQAQTEAVGEEATAVITAAEVNEATEVVAEEEAVGEAEAIREVAITIKGIKLPRNMVFEFFKLL